ncbi:hypothetical protein AB3N60_05380 [Leptospira sp. WS39.C2]
MQKIHFLFPFLVLCLLFCSPEEEKGIIPGTKITGDPLADALLLGVLANPPCQMLTSENANTTLTIGEGQTSICSTQLVNGSIQVQTTAVYQLSATPGKQTLSSSRCNSTYFDFHITLKEGNSDLFSSGSPTQSQFTLESGKRYDLAPTGLVDSSLYQCQGRPVSSSITPYRINFRKL